MIDTSVRGSDIRASCWMFFKKLPLDIWIYCTAWLVFIFIPKSWDRMPHWLRYYEDFTYGINGDEYWVNPDLKDHPPTDEAKRSYLWRLRWCLRNANTYDHERGIDPRAIVRVEHDGDPKVGNRPLVEGDLTIHAWDANGNRYWCYYSVHKNGWFPSRCKRYYIGWKLKDLLDEYLKDGVLNNDPNQRDILPAVFSPNPVMGYSQ